MRQSLNMSSNWIPRPIIFRSISLPADTRVCMLIDPNHQWNDGLIEQHFAKEDAEIIKGTPLLRTPQKDELIWHYDRKRQYTVKSGYQYLKFADFPTSSTYGSHGWHTIWTLNYPKR